MKKALNSISGQLKLAETAITNTLADAVIAAAVATYGYSTTRLNEGRLLHATAVDKVDAAIAAVGARRLASDHVVESFGVARGSYQALSKVARVIFADQPANLDALGLNEPMPRGMDDFAVKAHILFNTTEYTGEISDALEAAGYTGSKLSLERGKIAEFETARAMQVGCKGDAQQAKSEQRTALKALRKWYMAYRKICRVALREKPELLEKLGILHRSVKTKAQRNAPRKAAETRAKKKQQNGGENDASNVA